MGCMYVAIFLKKHSSQSEGSSKSFFLIKMVVSKYISGIHSEK